MSVFVWTPCRPGSHNIISMLNIKGVKMAGGRGVQGLTRRVNITNSSTEAGTETLTLLFIVLLRRSK